MQEIIMRKGISTVVKCAAALALAAGFGAVRAAEDAHAHHHHNHVAAPAADKRSVENYRLPAQTMLRQDGSKANFAADLDNGQPVILNFIYTSCTAICPVTAQVFSQVQDKLGADRDKVRMVSVSIDPEFDTPARLDAFAKKHKAGSQWRFYTGTRDASIAVQKAFDAYRGDKMNHVPVTYMRAAPGKPWIRLDGLRSPDDLVKEVRALLAS